MPFTKAWIGRKKKYYSSCCRTCKMNWPKCTKACNFVYENFKFKDTTLEIRKIHCEPCKICVEPYCYNYVPNGDEL